MITTLLVHASLAATLAPGPVVVDVTGLDCGGCIPEIEASLKKVPGVSAVRVSYVAARGCVILSRPVDSDAIAGAISKAGFTAGAMTAADTCPAEVNPGRPRSLWSEAGTLDVVVVSKGEDVDLATLRAPGKVIVVDFGAVWCGPCLKSVATLMEHLESHADVAVRAVELPGAVASESFESPIAQRYLKYAPALPYLIVYGPDGQERYKGPSVEKAIAATESP